MDNLKPIVMTCGGTGGHIYPAIALAQTITQASGQKIHFIGTSTREDAKIIPKYHYPFTAIMVSDKNKLALIPAIIKAFLLLIKLKPSCVISTGGFSTIPASIAAIIKGIPLYLLEQNAIAGRTNLLFARFATHIFTAFKDTRPLFPQKKTTHVGNPIRTQFAKDKTGQFISSIKFEKPPLLIFGGSQGARHINHVISANYAHLIDQDIPFIHIVGQTGYPQLVTQLIPSPYWEKESHLDMWISKTGQQVILPYCEAMDMLYHISGIVIARSGATTTAELAHFQKKAILIPFPHAKDDHQTANAIAHSAEYPSQIITDTQLTWETIAQAITALAKQQPPPQKANSPAEEICKIIRESNRKLN